MILTMEPMSSFKFTWRRWEVHLVNGHRERVSNRG